MAYDERLAERIRDSLAAREQLSEREMFGGVCWMIAGNMACGVLGDELIVRLGNEDGERALAEPGVRPFDFTGRPMRSTVFVASSAIADDRSLAGWVDAGVDFAAGLPAKAPNA